MEKAKIWFRAFWAREKEKLDKLTTRQKIRYIWDYYWLWILGIVCFFSIGGYMIYRACFAVKDYWFFCVFANTMEDGGNGSGLWKDFVAYSGYDTSQKKVEMNASMYFDPSIPGGTNNSYYQGFVALVESGELDCVVMNTEGLQGVGSSGRLLDLTDESCQEIYAKYKDRLVYCEPYDEEYEKDLVPVGIDISDSLLITKYHLYEGDCALGISAYTSRPEGVETFLEFLFSEAEEVA